VKAKLYRSVNAILYMANLAKNANTEIVCVCVCVLVEICVSTCFLYVCVYV